MPRYVAFGRLRGGLLNNAVYTNARTGGGGDEPTAATASLMMLGRAWCMVLMPKGNNVLTVGDQAQFLGLYSGLFA